MTIIVKIFIVYIIGYLIGTFIWSIPHDPKFNSYKSRVQFAAICMIVWPLLIILTPIHYFNVERNMDTRMLKWEKEKNVRWHLQEINPSLINEWDAITRNQKGTIKLIHEYLKENNLTDGIKLIKDKSVTVDEFKLWVKNNIK